MRLISPGNRMPFCAGMDAHRQPYSFDVQAGRAAVLVLASGSSAAAVDPLMNALAASQPALAGLDADLLLLLGFAAGPSAWQSGPGAGSGVPIILCHDDFFTRCAAPADLPMVVVIDRASRVMASWVAPDLAGLTAAVLAVVRQAGREPARDCVLPAPVLAVPGLFTAALCQELIDRFETGAHFNSGVSGADPGGKPSDQLNADKKRRRDWLLQPGEDIHERVLDLLFARCGPDIKRAFQSDVTYADRVLVARYDDTGGYFRRHRDNRGETVAFRQFALSVNLNDGYEGGHLLFPECNDHRYHPAVGEGIVFSASLLHEATPVTLGRRYVLLTFLHDARAEAHRVAVIDAVRRRELTA
jgi:hypothetical protein